jgi:hypothetical protein
MARANRAPEHVTHSHRHRHTTQTPLVFVEHEHEHHHSGGREGTLTGVAFHRPHSHVNVTIRNEVRP